MGDKKWEDYNIKDKSSLSLMKAMKYPSKIHVYVDIGNLHNFSYCDVVLPWQYSLH